MRLSQSCFAAASLLVVAMLAAAQSEAPKTISICELFKDLRSHAGQVVSVRGTLYSGREVFALGGKCDTYFVTKYAFAQLPEELMAKIDKEDFVWPTALELVGSWYAVFVAGEVIDDAGPLDFETDEDSVERVLTLLKRERAGGHEVEIFVTVVGELRMRDRYVVGKSNGGTLLGGGLGHLGTYPGRLVIKTMLDPEVKPKPAK